jgi:serine/threonine protein kinase
MEVGAGEALVGHGTYAHVHARGPRWVVKVSRPPVVGHDCGPGPQGVFLLDGCIVRETTTLRFLREMQGVAAIAPPVRAMVLCARHPACEIEMARGVVLHQAVALLTAAERVQVARQLLVAGACMGAVGVRHRDLSPGNVVVHLGRLAGAASKLRRGGAGASRVRAHLIDWGFAGSVTHDVCVGCEQGTLVYSAPEVYVPFQTDRPRTGGPSRAFDAAAADVWSLGSLILSLFVDVRAYWPKVFGVPKAPSAGAGAETWRTKSRREALDRVQAMCSTFQSPSPVGLRLAAGMPAASPVQAGDTGTEADNRRKRRRLARAQAPAVTHARPRVGAFAVVRAAFEAHGLCGSLLPLLESMLELDPGSRPTWEAIAGSAFVGARVEYEAAQQYAHVTMVRGYLSLQAPMDADAYRGTVVPELARALRATYVEALPSLALVVPLVEAWFLCPHDAVTDSIADCVQTASVGVCASRVCCKYLGLPPWQAPVSAPDVAAAFACEARLLQDPHLPPLPLLGAHNPVLGAVNAAVDATAVAVRALPHDLLVALLCLLYVDVRMGEAGALAPSPAALLDGVIGWASCCVDGQGCRPTFHPPWTSHPLSVGVLRSLSHPSVGPH